MRAILVLCAALLLVGCCGSQPPTMTWQPLPAFVETPTPGLQYYQRVAPQMVPLMPQAAAIAPTAAPCR